MASAMLDDLGGGVHRVTHPLPWALHHVHTYAIAGSDGWTLIDTGLGDAEALPRWRDAVAALGSPRIVRILLTHHHPDHVGAGASLAQWTGAQVLQGRLDAAVTDAIWRRPDQLAEFETHLIANGMPAPEVARAMTERRRLPVHPAEPDRLLDEDDTIELAGESFRIVWLPGHADGHIAFLGERSGRMFGGDVLLEKITPNIGCWQRGASDPLGTYLATLTRLAELAVTVVYSGHRRPITDVRARAGEIRAHHASRLNATLGAVRSGATSAYHVARCLFGDQLTGHELRFALAEALAHLERLRRTGAVITSPDGCWMPAA